MRSHLTEQELRDLYTPTADEAAFVARTTQSPVAAFGCMVLVKTFQRRSLAGVDRRQVLYVKPYHITKQKLLDANVSVINRYTRFMLPTLWGSGQRAAADGTKWDVYEHNLLKEPRFPFLVTLFVSLPSRRGHTVRWRVHERPAPDATQRTTGTGV